jgi:heme a synthase
MPVTGRCERWRVAALEADAADPSFGAATAALGTTANPQNTFGSGQSPIAAGVRGIAAWPRQKFRTVAGGLVLVFAVLQGLSQRGSALSKAIVGGFATITVITLSFVIIGRWVRMSPRIFRRIALVSALLLGFIIFTGAAVRLTGSGLGCPTWPNCQTGQLAAQFGESSIHDDIEFGNRIVTGLCIVAAGMGVLGAVARKPYRRDLTQLGWVVVALIMGNAVLGGFVVLYELKPQIVMGHFLLSIASLAVAIVIFHRTGEAHGSSLLGRERQPVSDALTVWIGRALTVCTLMVLFLGTIVTGSGPHGGDPDVERFALSMRSTTQLHSGAAWIVVGLSMALSVRVSRWRIPQRAEVLKRCTVLLAALAMQGAIGYFQYFNQVPAGLVFAHVVGAVALWAAVLWVRASLTKPVPFSTPKAASARSRTPGIRAAVDIS